MRLFLILLFLITQAMCVSRASNGENSNEEKAQRRQMQKSNLKVAAPKRYEKRYRQTPDGKEKMYDPKPHVEVIDERAGKYAFKWIGYDGKEKVVEYQRYDAADVVVSASAEKSGDSKFSCSYKVQNLLASPAFLSGFMVQNFTQNAVPIERDSLHIGQMSSNIKRFKDGKWFHFAPLAGTKIMPGQIDEFKIISPSPPGLVECAAASGPVSLKGVGEHMPSELEKMMNGYDEMLGGYTIGPVDELKELSTTERAKYLLRRLRQFVSAGWMTSAAQTRYEQILNKDDLSGALKQAEKDLKTEQITSEVYSIVQGLNY